MIAAEHERRGRTVLVEDTIEVAAPTADIGPVLLSGEAWLAPMAGDAEGDGAALVLRVGPSWGAERFRREVRATLGGYRPRGDGFVLWLRWEAAELRPLFPVLDGDLAVTPLGPDRSKITLSASYVPPLGAFGLGLDRALLHRLAASSVHAFLERLASVLESREEGDRPAP